MENRNYQKPEHKKPANKLPPPPPLPVVGDVLDAFKLDLKASGRHDFVFLRKVDVNLTTKKIELEYSHKPPTKQLTDNFKIQVHKIMLHYFGQEYQRDWRIAIFYQKDLTYEGETNQFNI